MGGDSQDKAHHLKLLCEIAREEAATTLTLTGTALTDLTPLAGLTQLQRLYLAGTAVSDLAPLAGLTQLRTLFLSSAPVSDLGPLAGLTQLRWLSVNGTAVSDLGPLAGLTQLKTLFLPTEVADDQIDRLRTALPILEVHRL
jgi:Leucine-rich repeat (LRR) protein